MAPLISIITPTILRQSLLQCCQSLSLQSFQDWEHIVMIDTDKEDPELLQKVLHPKRHFAVCDQPHKNCGNTCRHNAYDYATGDFIFYLDDDNYLEENILADLQPVLPEIEHWGLFPINRLGGVFYSDPPRPCYIDTMNVIVRREIAQWPDIEAYCSDGVFIGDLLAKYPYKAFPNFRTIAVLPMVSFGK